MQVTHEQNTVVILTKEIKISEKKLWPYVCAEMNPRCSEQTHPFSKIPEGVRMEMYTLDILFFKCYNGKSSLHT